MTGYESKKAAARDKLLDDDDTQVYQDHDDALTIAYQSGYYDGKKAAQPAQEPASVTYKEVQDSMNALEKGNLYQQAIAEELGQRKLYTTPPQRPWVGLTDEQIADFLGDEYHDMSESELRFFRLGEAATKEKNT